MRHISSILSDDQESEDQDEPEEGEPQGKRRRKDHPGLIQRDMPTVEEVIT